ncbi:MAG TPA: hypothetical protein VJC37_06115 [Planctomycetota bacterium]|nr:hypothetical protein [Planctomycetota bacterium]
MKKVLILVTLIVFITAPVLAEEQDPLEQKIAQVREEISLTNLINGLNLTESQLAGLISVLSEVQDMRKSYKEKHRALAEEMLKSFKDLQKNLENGPKLPVEVANQAGGNNERAKELGEEFKKKLAPYQEKVENVLTEAQKIVIDDFKPCLLPPKSQKNPVRVGQAKSNEQAIEHLRKLREISQDAYEQKRDTILNRYFSKFEEKKGKMNDEEKANEKKRLFELVDRVRAITPEEFELNKDELAEEFIIKDRAEELGNQLKDILEYRHKDKGGLNKIGRFFLKPEMLGILKTRLNTLKNFKPSEPANLDNIKNTPEPDKKKK